jgi:unsaturated rhamnogalacturonyl hydrolase
MFVYALAKGCAARLPAGQLPSCAEKGYRGIDREFLKTDANGQLNLEGTVSVAGLGATVPRWQLRVLLSEKVVTNDPKGVGALLLAATEMETRRKQSGKKRT